MTSDRLRLILGMSLLLSLVVFAFAVALGKVEEKTSFGLTPVMAILGKVSLDFSEWAFRTRREGERDEPKDKQ